MSVLIPLFFFVLLYILSILTIGQKKKVQLILLFFVCAILVYLVGNRDPERWADTSAYIIDFEDYTSPLYDFSINEQPFGYAEVGFHALGSIVKLFTTNVTIYLSFVSALTFFFLFTCLRKYCVFPLLGLCDYAARFLINRDFVQIRSSLAIVIVIFALQYLRKNDWVKYFAFVFLAYIFHHSAVLAIPLFFFNMIHISRKQIVWGLVIAFFLAFSFAPLIQSTVEAWSTDMQYNNYTGEEYQREVELGLRNPILYMQVFILLMFTFKEDKLKQTTDGMYYIYRNAYFYSTLILTVFCQYTALSGRTSTMFATAEMFILPLLYTTYTGRSRYVYLSIVGACMIGYFFLKVGGGVLIINHRFLI